MVKIIIGENKENLEYINKSLVIIKIKDRYLCSEKDGKYFLYSLEDLEKLGNYVDSLKKICTVESFLDKHILTDVYAIDLSKEKLDKKLLTTLLCKHEMREKICNVNEKEAIEFYFKHVEKKV